jgi:hypothetical protein
MTILVMASFVIAGLFGFKQLPVAAVPRVDFPTIQVQAQLPGASPETMAASVASILERQFATIAGVTTMTSTSSLGNTSIVLQFDLNRNIDGAALDVQSAISSAMRRLPVELPTPPSFRKVNPADYPIMFLALKSSQVRLSDVDAFANRAILPRISTLPGIAQVLIFGTQKYAVRVRANLDQLAVRGLTLQELQTAIVNANSTKPLGAIADSRQNAILDATGPINRAKDYMPVIVAWQNGAPVRFPMCKPPSIRRNDASRAGLMAPGILLAVFQPTPIRSGRRSQVRPWRSKVAAERVEIRTQRPVEIDLRCHRDGFTLVVLLVVMPSISSCAVSAPRLSRHPVSDSSSAPLPACVCGHSIDKHLAAGTHFAVGFVVACYRHAGNHVKQTGGRS